MRADYDELFESHGSSREATFSGCPPRYRRRYPVGDRPIAMGWDWGMVGVRGARDPATEGHLAGDTEYQSPCFRRPARAIAPFLRVL